MNSGAGVLLAVLARCGLITEGDRLISKLDLVEGNIFRHTHFLLYSRSHWSSLVCTNGSWKLHDDGQVFVIPNGVLIPWVNAFNGCENHRIYSLHRGKKVPLRKQKPYPGCQVFGEELLLALYNEVSPWQVFGKGRDTEKCQPIRVEASEVGCATEEQGAVAEEPAAE